MNESKEPQTELLEIDEFLDVIRNTRVCCLNQPTRLVRYDTGREGDEKYRDLLVCDEHFNLEPFYRNIVKMLDIHGIFKTPASEWNKELKDLIHKDV